MNPLNAKFSITLIGASYKTVPLHVLDGLSREITAELVWERLSSRVPRLSFGILSTCNRVEVYCVCRGYLHEVDGSTLGYPEGFYVLRDKEAVRHLIRVACGLDSLALGEEQIMLQVRKVEVLGSDGLCKHAASRLFRHAYLAAKRIRLKAGLSTGLSVASLAAELVRRKLGEGLSVLVVGAGRTARTVIENLLTLVRPREVYVATRNPERVTHDLAIKVKAVLGLRSLPEVIREVDAALVATSSPSYIIDENTLSSSCLDRRLLIVDISMPRNVSPALSNKPGVELHYIDDLAELVDVPPISEESVNGYIEHEVERYMAWLSTLSLGPLIKSLRERAEVIRKEEVARSIRLLKGEPMSDAVVLESLSRRIVNKLLHTPTTRLKELASGSDGINYVRAFMELFGIDEEGN